MGKRKREQKAPCKLQDTNITTICIVKPREPGKMNTKDIHERHKMQQED
jgi:hypothetical protein